MYQRAWTRLVPASAERASVVLAASAQRASVVLAASAQRASFVLAASAALALLPWQWWPGGAPSGS